MHARLILGLAALLAASVPARAEDDGAREADACQGDVHRLCDKYFPDETLVATCLVDRRAELSQGCAELLANPPGIDAKRAEHAAPSDTERAAPAAPIDTKRTAPIDTKRTAPADTKRTAPIDTKPAPVGEAR